MFEILKGKKDILEYREAFDLSTKNDNIDKILKFLHFKDKDKDPNSNTDKEVITTDKINIGEVQEESETSIEVVDKPQGKEYLIPTSHVESYNGKELHLDLKFDDLSAFERKQDYEVDSSSSRIPETTDPEPKLPQPQPCKSDDNPETRREGE